MIDNIFPKTSSTGKFGEAQFKAGAAFTNITPQDSHFLHGYPFVERTSTGTHDLLLSSALYLSDGKEEVLFISNDIIYISKDMVTRIRRVISEKKGIPASNIMIAATHTHSGPVTVDCIISENDPIVPKVDRDYLRYMEKKTVQAAFQAIENAVSAEIAFVTGDATGAGTNRHDPSGAKDMEVPAMIVRNSRNKEYIASMLVCSMHPTILHEDSRLYSSDFPYFVREKLQQELLGTDCPVIYFTGTAGNQSPRHVTKSNTFEEAHRIGEIVAGSILSKLTEDIVYSSEWTVRSVQTGTDLPKRKFPAVEWAQQRRDKAKKRFEELGKSSGNRQEVRTAEVDWFGAEELLFLTKKAQSNLLDEAYKNCLPAEIQMIRIGYWSFIAWPGEIFAEYGLELKALYKNISLITYANGELQGYITTKEAVDKGFYEAGNSLFDYRSGGILIKKTIDLLERFR
ncbi:neutral/alkaline non-lysosomal ceramidase N-terminal domain-containing protein [uncultured Proteiniphilum sp.]|uniref:neutral/alkaline non-lysosomal ceramidase N-terminal domain-containing protein n=1 Tax=uncultured Proteiniphilum sp. TaxID=497637 RepID=UPI0026219C1F|nr:neutral/alkaline non-lysosomal ceramidase N-terminal domain-containing protein [uncultured Proteiniphilum sp.]